MTLRMNTFNLKSGIASVRATRSGSAASLSAKPPVIGIIALLLLFCSSVAGPAFAAGLNVDQIQLAADLATSTDWQMPVVGNKQAAHPLGRQILFVEKPENKKFRTTRFASVYEFNYASMSARLLVIDLLTVKVQTERFLDVVHLPLNQTEIDFAVSLLNQDKALLQQLRDDQIRRGQTPFTRLTELDIKASIFEPNTYDDQAPHKECTRQRCALISLFDQTRTVFSIEPIVNLSTLQLKRLTRQ